MDHKKISFQDTQSFSPFFLDYIQQEEKLKKFYNRFPAIEAFEDQIRDKQKSFSFDGRSSLHKVLKAQYSELTITPLVESNIDALKDHKTFTITTGHQLNIFTGPLYFIYKIVSVINACRALKKQYPKYTFVPVYWMASEDHDFEEISYFKLNGKKYSWKTDQLGAVGRFNPKELKSILEEIPGDNSIFRNAYLKHQTLGEAVRYYVNELFGEEGLVVVDADDHDLKAAFREVITEDIFENTPKICVEKTNKELDKAGYPTQVFARDINFFYLEKSIRSRIEQVGDRFQVVDTDLSFSKEELKKLIAAEPEKFSPNVILRPLYQEVILPNLAYFGGPSEVVYWLQLKGVFDHFKIPFPILMPRNFAMVMSGPISRKFEKTGLSLAEIFKEKNILFKDWTLRHTDHNLSLEKELHTISKLLTDLKSRVQKIDTTLITHLDAESKKITNKFKNIEKKMVRAEKRNHEDKLRQISEVKDALFPNGSPQERSDNFLNFYQQDPNFIKALIAAFDPFDYQFNVLRYPFD